MESQSWFPLISTVKDSWRTFIQKKFNFRDEETILSINQLADEVNTKLQSKNVASSATRAISKAVMDDMKLKQKLTRRELRNSFEKVLTGVLRPVQ